MTAGIFARMAAATVRACSGVTTRSTTPSGRSSVVRKPVLGPGHGVMAPIAGGYRERADQTDEQSDGKAFVHAFLRSCMYTPSARPDRHGPAKAGHYLTGPCFSQYRCPPAISPLAFRLGGPPSRSTFPVN